MQKILAEWAKVCLWFIHVRWVTKSIPYKLCCGKREHEAETAFAYSTPEVASLKSFGLSPGVANFLHRKFLSTAQGRLGYIRVNKHCRLKVVLFCNEIKLQTLVYKLLTRKVWALWISEKRNKYMNSAQASCHVLYFMQ